MQLKSLQYVSLLAQVNFLVFSRICAASGPPELMASEIFFCCFTDPGQAATARRKNLLRSKKEHTVIEPNQKTDNRQKAL